MGFALIFNTPGLMWAAEDNGEDIDWKDAKRYCDDFEGGGYKDWRMPTLDELESLYDRSEKGYPAECWEDFTLCTTKLIRLSCCCPWASDTSGSGAAYFNFNYGLRNWVDPSSSAFSRVLPVRGGK